MSTVAERCLAFELVEEEIRLVIFHNLAICDLWLRWSGGWWRVIGGGAGSISE